MILFLGSGIEITVKLVHSWYNWRNRALPSCIAVGYLLEGIDNTNDDVPQEPVREHLPGSSDLPTDPKGCNVRASSDSSLALYMEL
jgi:hypothetical protein